MLLANRGWGIDWQNSLIASNRSMERDGKRDKVYWGFGSFAWVRVSPSLPLSLSPSHPLTPRCDQSPSSISTSEGGFPSHILEDRKPMKPPAGHGVQVPSFPSRHCYLRSFQCHLASFNHISFLHIYLLSAPAVIGTFHTVALSLP